jgi:predicted HNH restriction endonuclease
MRVHVDLEQLYTADVDDSGQIHIGEDYAGKSVEIAVLNPEIKNSSLEITGRVGNSTSDYYERHSGEKWERAREAVLERDGAVCLSCGITMEQHIQDDSRFGGIHVHHIVPVKLFDEPDDAHEMYNLVSLCDKHHREAEIHGVLSVCSKGDLPKEVLESL